MAPATAPAATLQAATAPAATLQATPAPPADAGEIIAAMQALHTPKVVPFDPEQPAVLVIPKGMEVRDIDDTLDTWRDTPRARDTTDAVQDLASLITLTQRHKEPQTTIVFGLADRSAPKITTVFDYHPATPDRKDARRRNHRVRYDCKVSEEWQRWTGVHRKGLKQSDFAEFLEDRISDVVVPSDAVFPAAAEFAQLMGMRLADPAELIQLSRGLQVTVGSTVKQAQQLASGEASVVFETRHETQVANSPVSVPGLFLIAIPVFFGGTRFVVPVRLRYRVDGAGIIWTLVLHRHEQAFDDAFQAMLAEVREKTALPVVLGALDA